MVCEGILVLRGYKDISWLSAKGMMSDSNFLRSLMEMDCDLITNSQVSTVKGEGQYILGKSVNLGFYIVAFLCCCFQSKSKVNFI